jgi:superfamily II DNA or RNA helicase
LERPEAVTRTEETERMDGRYHNAEQLGITALTITGDRAELQLPGWTLAAYETFVRVKGALPRYDVIDPFPRYGGGKLPQIACSVHDLPALGLAPPVPATTLAPDVVAPLFADQLWVTDVAFRRKRFAIFAEAGWGKTVTQLALAQGAIAATGLPALIIAPLSVVPQTIAEARRFWPSLAVVDAKAFGGVRAWLDSSPGAALGIVNVDAFRKPVSLDGLGAVLLDESSVLKAMSGITRNNLVRAVAPVEYRYAFSATPAPNDLEEYISHALFLGAIKQHKEFFADFFDADGEGGWHLRPYARAAFYRFLSTWSVWMRRPERYGFPPRLGGIPTPSFADVEVELTPEQYEESKPHRKAGNLLLDEVGIVKRSKLAQISRGFIYENSIARRIPSHKPARVAACVAAHPGERAVVWVAFDEEAAIIAEALRDVGRTSVTISGETEPEARFAAVEAINAGTGPDVIIAKPATMGFGINMQGASVVVFSGVGDSFEQDYQALRRSFRYGQTRAVRCYYVVTSLERMMLDNVRAKRDAWEEQTTAMEESFAAAHETELAAWRGAALKPQERTAFTLTNIDRAALATIGGSHV